MPYEDDLDFREISERGLCRQGGGDEGSEDGAEDAQQKSDGEDPGEPQGGSSQPQGITGTDTSPRHGEAASRPEMDGRGSGGRRRTFTPTTVVVPEQRAAISVEFFWTLRITHF